MSGSRVYDFHQQEVDNLKSAAIYTLAVCTNLKRMLEGIRDDQPRWASRAIDELLDPNYQCKSYVDKVDHLISPVSVSVNVPRRTKMHRGPDGIHYEDKFPLVIEMREEPLAHHAAWVIHDMVVRYLWSVWRRGNPGLIYCDALEATDELVGPRWNEIRGELRAFVDYDYDFDGLRQAVEEESKAAIAQCRQTIVGDTMATHKPNNGKTKYLGITLGDREALRIVNDKTLTASFGRKGKPWEMFRELYHAGHNGLARADITKTLWPDQPITDNALDQHKATVNKLLETIRVEIKPDNHGVWRLAELNF